ncbi:MAG TPA: hypothetical protein VN033_13685 [Vulgatibacter sp.]|nr:hypothetical protein [Vulgatibacter sp.]
MKALERRIQAAEEALAEQGRSITMEEAIYRSLGIEAPPRPTDLPDEVSGLEAVILRIEREKAERERQG